MFAGLLISTIFGCQSQTVSNTTNQMNSNIPANNANTVNQTNAETAAPRDVKFESADKLEIVGTFYESPKAGSPAVLLLHQFGSNRKSYDEYAKRLQKESFGVLAIDGRGFGESTKTTDGKTVTQNSEAESLDADLVKKMKTDVGNAFEFLSKQKNVDAKRIGIVGASYGSSLAMIYAADNPNVKAVALLSPGINYFGTMPTIPAIKSYGDRPLLLVAAEDDKESADAVRQLKSVSANDEYETKVYEKGGHGTALFDVGLQDLVEVFLTKNL